jgi:hypothetical protein
MIEGQDLRHRGLQEEEEPLDDPATGEFTTES